MRHMQWLQHKTHWDDLERASKTSQGCNQGKHLVNVHVFKSLSHTLSDQICCVHEVYDQHHTV